MFFEVFVNNLGKLLIKFNHHIESIGIFHTFHFLVKELYVSLNREISLICKVGFSCSSVRGRTSPFCPSNLGYVLSGPRVLATFTRLLSIANPPLLSMDSTVTFSVMGLPDNTKITSSPSLSFLASFFSFSYLFYLEIFFMQIYEIILYLLHYLFYFL